MSAWARGAVKARGRAAPAAAGCGRAPEKELAACAVGSVRLDDALVDERFEVLVAHAVGPEAVLQADPDWEGEEGQVEVTMGILCEGSPGWTRSRRCGVRGLLI